MMLASKIFAFVKVSHVNALERRLSIGRFSGALSDRFRHVLLEFLGRGLNRRTFRTSLLPVEFLDP